MKFITNTRFLKTSKGCQMIKTFHDGSMEVTDILLMPIVKVLRHKQLRSKSFALL